MSTAADDQPQPAPLTLAPSANGRVSGKAWKEPKTATVCVPGRAPAPAPTPPTQLTRLCSRSHLPAGVKTRSWQERMDRTKRDQAAKKVAQELKDEAAQEKARRRAVTQERKKAAEEKARLELAKATMGARKAARLKKRMGRSKKVHG
ncbi:hypothetical protein AURDEDRAFT_49748 [Auricularia subglabra TFB-10046 SS5]|nr:hypothetical protein AURDEDRAFT_49748 [Auricularia subglabra TFB-10046 SS5]